MNATKRLPVLLTIALGLTLGLAVSSIAADKPPVTTEADKAAYPLTTCVVSGEKLGSMGKPLQYVHHEAGKPDRTVLLCCESCVDDFKENPAKFLAKLDAATKVPAKK